ncbi:MAG: hypothetical protein ACOCZK_02560 [Planctomycetota bacterium]
MRREPRCVAAGLLVFLLLGACTTRVIPPGSVADPVTVYLVESGWHATVCLPEGDGHVSCWDYGEWAYFAKGRDYCCRAIPAALWPTRATLARCRFLVGSAPEAAVQAMLERWLHGERSWRFTVERARSEDLQDKLAALFAQAADTRIQPTEHPTQFVHHPQSYHLFSTCNHMTKRWLRRLGCAIAGPWLSWDYAVAQPAGGE